MQLELQIVVVFFILWKENRRLVLLRFRCEAIWMSSKFIAVKQ